MQEVITSRLAGDSMHGYRLYGERLHGSEAAVKRARATDYRLPTTDHQVDSGLGVNEKAANRVLSLSPFGSHAKIRLSLKADF